MFPFILMRWNIPNPGIETSESGIEVDCCPGLHISIVNWISTVPSSWSTSPWNIHNHLHNHSFEHCPWKTIIYCHDKFLWILHDVPWGGEVCQISNFLLNWQGMLTWILQWWVHGNPGQGPRHIHGICLKRWRWCSPCWILECLDNDAFFLDRSREVSMHCNGQHLLPL